MSKAPAGVQTTAGDLRLEVNIARTRVVTGVATALLGGTHVQKLHSVALEWLVPRRDY